MNISRVTEIPGISELLQSGSQSRSSSAQFGSVLRAGPARVVSLAAGRCTVEAEIDAGSVWSCADADADAAIGSVSSSSERETPHTDEHRC